jgi:tRNA modification GTPase
VKEGVALDLPESWMEIPNISISALHNEKIDELKNLIASVSLGEGQLDKRNTIIPNLRHKLALEAGIVACRSAVNDIEKEQPYELVAINIQEAIDCLGDILGITIKTDVMDRIFSQFCIGK